jgi:DNA-binding SARP family transcriptional activator
VAEATIRFKEACPACPERSRGELVEEACSELVEEADLRIYLLGLPRAECLGGVLAVPRRQVRALLFRLAARLQPVSREYLCFLFWPDLPESTARRNLSRLLPQLRSALRVPQVLVITDDQVWLDPDHVWSDTATFERLCAEREPQRQIDAFAQAIDLYRGPFLDAFSLPGSPEFETWVKPRQ